MTSALQLFPDERPTLARAPQDLARWVLDAVQGMVGADVPPLVKRVENANRKGKVVTAVVRLFDGSQAEIKITDGMIRCFEWTSLPGGAVSYEDGDWRRVGDLE